MSSEATQRKTKQRIVGRLVNHHKPSPAGMGGLDDLPEGWNWLVKQLGSVSFASKGYIARRPNCGPPHAWTDAQFTRVKHYFDQLEHLKENPMQQVFTLEVSVDFKDKDKYDLMRNLMARAAREVYGGAALLTDHIKPRVAIFSDDFFQTHEELALMHGADNEGAAEKPAGTFSVKAAEQALAQASADKGTQAAAAGTARSLEEAPRAEAPEDTMLSPELLAALR